MTQNVVFNYCYHSTMAEAIILDISIIKKTQLTSLFNSFVKANSLKSWVI